MFSPTLRHVQLGISLLLWLTHALCGVPLAAQQAADSNQNLKYLLSGTAISEEAFAKWAKHRSEFAVIPWIENAETRYETVSSEPTETQYTGKFYLRLPSRNIALWLEGISLSNGRDNLSLVEQIRRAIPYFPETSSVAFEGFNDGEISKPLRAIRDLPHLSAIRFRNCTLSRYDLVELSRFTRLRRIENLVCEPQDFSLTAKLQDLKWISMPTTLTPDCFVTLSKLPKLKTIRILQGPFEKNGYLEPQGFNKPIRDSIRQAITSMDGRLQSFVSDEFTPIHPSIVRELCRIRSLHTLVIGEPITGLRLADVKPLADHQGLGRQGSDKSVLVQGLEIHGDPNDPNLTPRERTQLQRFLSDQRRRINDAETRPN